MKEIATIINMARLAIFQGIYYLITGIWPILSIESFMAVTGPKEEIWLVRTIGMLIFFVGAGLIAAGIKKQVSAPIIIIASGSAFGFLTVDVTYVWLNVISPVYLLDAVLQVIILCLWIVLIYKEKQDKLHSGRFRDRNKDRML